MVLTGHNESGTMQCMTMLKKCSVSFNFHNLNSTKVINECAALFTSMYTIYFTEVNNIISTTIIMQILESWTHVKTSKCDWIWENPAYCQNVHMAQCMFLVSTVKKYESPLFVIFMSKNLSTNCCHRLWRVNVSYQDEISHFDLPSQYSCRTRSPLLWALIRIPYLDTARFIEVLYAFLASWASKNNWRPLSTSKSDPFPIFTFISNGSTQVHLIDILFMCSIQKRHTCA